MAPRRLFWIFAVVVLVLVASAVISFRKMHQVTMVVPPQPDNTVVVETPGASPLPSVALPEASPSPENKVCHTQPEYLQIHRELGLMINKNSEIREKRSQRFLSLVNDFRNHFGLPFPLAITSNKAEENAVVYNNCKPACKGTVNVVFASRVVGGTEIEVLTKEGKLKRLPLHDSGIDVLTVDELNKKGVPFRTWRVPVLSEWSIAGNDLFSPLDIEGLWLKVDSQSRWEVVGQPRSLVKLQNVEPAVKVPGCTPDESCLQTSGGKGLRYFKAPRFCESVVKHAADEPADHPSTESSSPTP